MDTPIFVGILTASAGLVGAGIGGGIALLNGRLQARRQREADDLKWMRESRVRYNTERVDAYAAFLRLGQELETADWTSPGPPDATGFTVAFYRVEILASSPVRVAAAQYHSALISPILSSKMHHAVSSAETQEWVRRVAQQPQAPSNPATAQWFNEMMATVNANPIVNADGRMSLSAILNVLDTQKVLLEAIRKELGVASLEGVAPKQAMPPVSRRRPFRRKKANANATPESGADVGKVR